MNYNLICIFICSPICTKKFILVKSGCYKVPIVNEFSNVFFEGFSVMPPD
jgi:hypothetical protein